MDYDRATKKEQFKTALAGVSAECDMVNGVVHSITLRDGNGGLLRVERSNDYEALKAFVPAKPKLVKRWKLSGSFKGLNVDETLTSEFDAQQRRNELEGYEELYVLSIAEVEIPEEN